MNAEFDVNIHAQVYVRVFRASDTHSCNGLVVAASRHPSNRTIVQKTPGRREID